VTGSFAPEHVNAEDQRRDPDSLLAFLTALTHRYRDCPELGWGTFELIEQPHTCVLAHSVTWDDARLVALHNLSPGSVTVDFRLDDIEGSTRLVDLLDDDAPELKPDGQVTVALDGYAFRWLRVVDSGDRRLT
jgi:glycosidase